MEIEKMKEAIMAEIVKKSSEGIRPKSARVSLYLQPARRLEGRYDILSRSTCFGGDVAGMVTGLLRGLGYIAGIETTPDDAIYSRHDGDVVHDLAWVEFDWVDEDGDTVCPDDRGDIGFRVSLTRDADIDGTCMHFFAFDLADD